MLFADLGLKPELLRAVSEKGYTTPTPIQSQAIPTVLSGRDVLAGAQTGTGKTAGFILPLLQKLDRPQGRNPRAVVLAPTRELAAQIAESARVYGRYLSIRTCVVFGGVSINPQIDALRAGCDLLIATPGRLLDLAEQRAVSLSDIKCFVLDEADRMLDMGFIHAIKQVLRLMPPSRQNLMFSATYSEEIRGLASRILRDPATIEVATRNATADRVDQEVYRVSKELKQRLLAHLIDSGSWHQVLVFTRTKHGANRLAKQLEASGIRSAAIHGNKSQAARVRALADFKSSKVTALVATEVAARGLDIKELPHVVNYELPNVPEDYVHRIGRTARAGATGHAVSLVSPDETPLLRDIERMMNRNLSVTAMPPLPASTALPIEQDDRAEQGDRPRRSGNGPWSNNTGRRRDDSRRNNSGRPNNNGSRFGNQSPGNRAPRQDSAGSRGPSHTPHFNSNAPRSPDSQRTDNPGQPNQASRPNSSKPYPKGASRNRSGGGVYNRDHRSAARPARSYAK